MLLLKFVLVAGGVGLFVAVLIMLVSDAYRGWAAGAPIAPRWPLAARLAVFGCAPLLLAHVRGAASQRSLRR